jgi:hypothetical protein
MCNDILAEIMAAITLTRRGTERSMPAWLAVSHSAKPPQTTQAVDIFGMVGQCRRKDPSLAMKILSRGGRSGGYVISTSAALGLSERDSRSRRFQGRTSLLRPGVICVSPQPHGLEGCGVQVIVRFWSAAEDGHCKMLWNWTCPPWSIVRLSISQNWRWGPRDESLARSDVAILIYLQAIGSKSNRV